MNKHLLLSIVAAAVIFPLSAPAEIYKHVDADGRVTYSNVKTKGAKKLDLEPNDTSFGSDSSEQKTAPKRAQASKTATPASFPKVDADTQKQRDGSRKDILKSELAAEKSALAEANKAYTEGESNPEVFKTANGKTLRNVAKFQEKMKTLQADVDAHQRNIELLEKEIGTSN